MKSTKFFYTKILNTINDNEVYLCNCNIILEYYLQPSDKLLPANHHDEVEGIGQTLLSAGRSSLAVAIQTSALRALSYTLQAALRAWREDLAMRDFQ